MNKEIKVMVDYMPASKPFKTDAMPTTTVGEIKTATLAAFGLTEDANKIYKLFHNKVELANLSQTIGDIAQHASALNLKLEEVLVQGAQ
jgi:hypothetical protein